MKQTSRFRSLLAVACLTCAASTHSQTWSSEEVILPGPDPASAPTGIGYAVLINPFVSTPAPGVFVGLGSANAGAASILRLTPLDSASSAFQQDAVDTALTYVRGLAYNPMDGTPYGTLYSVGYAPVDPNARTIIYNWKVRRSTAQGAAGTWSEDDSFNLAKNANSYAVKVAVDVNGTVFVAGVAVDGKGAKPHWIVRRKTQGGTWATVFDATGNNINMVPSVCYFPGNAANPTPAVFTTSDLNSKWTVMRSQSQGASNTWKQVDSWLPNGGTEASAYDITCDPSSGYLYVVGCRGLNGKDPSAWVIRTSTDGGNSWTTLLDVSGSASWAARAVVDGNGNVSVSGVINPTATSSSGGKALWKVIRCTAPQDPANWAACFSNPDTIPFDLSTSAKGYGITADALGNVFVTGLVTDWTDATTSPATAYSGDRVGLLRLVP